MKQMPVYENEEEIYDEINEKVSTSLFIQGIIEKLSR